MQTLDSVDILIFCAYFVVLVGIGFFVGRGPKHTAEDYFLAGRKLPWYVVGASFIGSNISTEHFIGMIGITYVYGICVAQWEWGNIFAFSALIWVFIPFLLSSRVFTAPEFLERRFNSTCRLFFAVLTVVANITAFLAAVLYAAALGLKAMFGWPDYIPINLGEYSFDVSTIVLGVVGMGVIAGSYAIYGGLRSVAWTDVFQVVVMVFGGVLVTFYGLQYLGEGKGIVAGWKTMLARNLGQGEAWAKAIAEAAPSLTQQDTYNRLQIFQPVTHKLIPWPAIFFGWLSVSIWYNCINQFMIQRVFAAKDEWHARMGIVFAGFMKIFLPLIVVIPGLIYFAMDPTLTDKQKIDQGYAVMVVRLLHVGLRGLLLAALFGAIQSTVDSVLNSTSTIITLDIYKKFVRPAASEISLVKMGKWVSAAVLVVAMVLAPFIEKLGEGVFHYIQDLYAYFAPPFAAVFLAGVLWKRATAKAAAITIPAGIAFGFFLQFVVFQGGSSLLSVDDIRDWPGFCSKLDRERNEEAPSPGSRMWKLLPADIRAKVQDASQTNRVEEGSKADIVQALNDILKRRDFYQEKHFDRILVTIEARGLLKRKRESLSDKEVERLNRLLVEGAYPREITRSSIGLAFTLRSIFNWAFCMILMVIVSLVTKPPPPEKTTEDVTINWRTLAVCQNLGRPWYRNLALWYCLFVCGLIACYIAFSGLFLQ